MNYKVAILIPTLNAGSVWLDTLESIKSQTYQISTKIIIDSGSNDNTIALSKKYGFKIKEIDKSDFNHGKTRQQLVELSDEADICIFLTQDAILASSDSISNIINIFNDRGVGMAYGRQLPHKNALILESHARLYNYPGVSHIRTHQDLAQLGFKVFFCSNSFAAYRRDALLAIGGFPTDSIMGEDAIVAAKMLMAGYKKAYVADATVYHSHTYTLRQEFKRYFDTRVFHEQNKWLITDFGKPTDEGLKFVKSELGYVIKHKKIIILKSISSIGAKWLGYKLGKFYKQIPKKLLKQLSMHSYHWK